MGGRPSSYGRRNINLQDNAALRIHGGAFTVANHVKLEYRIDAKDKALV